jgi:arylsulfatase A-like enzyme
MRRAACWGCLLALLALAACARASHRPPNVVVVLIDTLRWDRLGAYGSGRGLTPFLDQFAERATVFHRAYAQSSWTNPSVASLFTSRYQSQHGVITFASTLAPEELTLAEVLRAHGYATGGFIANFLLQGRFGFDQGFDHWGVYSRTDPRAPSKYIKATAERINAESLAWLDAGSAGRASPAFLYLHYMEPHAPFEPAPAALAHVLAGRPAPDAARANEAMTLAPVIDFAANPALLQSVEDLYDADVMSLDAQLRTLFAALDQRGVLDNAVVVVTADHGEEFLEHGHVGHNVDLYNEVITVPLMVHLPGQTQRADVDDIVSLVDVAPTLLDLAGIPAPAAFEGHSFAGRLRAARDGRWSWAGLLTLLHGRQTRSGTAFSELIKPPDENRRSPHERAVVDGQHKLITGVDGEREYYDLAADPGEHQPAALTEAERLALERALEPLRAYAARGGGGHEVDEDTKERMRALGYAH